MGEEKKKEDEKESEEEKKESEHPDDKIARANSAADRLEDANKDHAALLDRQEALSVEKALGGESAAGEKPVEESAEDYAKKVMANDA